MSQFLTLARDDDMAGRAPRLRYPFAVVGVGRERALRREDCSDRKTTAERVTIMAWPVSGSKDKQ